MNIGSLALLGLVAPDLLDESKDWLRGFARKDPVDAILWTTIVCAHLFYRAEHGHNPKVKSYNDALVYVSTNLSVGYCDIFAMTEGGKQIATFLMVFGPAMAARTFDVTKQEAEARDAEESAHSKAMLDKLDRIAELLAPNAAPSADP